MIFNILGSALRGVEGEKRKRRLESRSPPTRRMRRSYKSSSRSRSFERWRKNKVSRSLSARSRASSQKSKASTVSPLADRFSMGSESSPEQYIIIFIWFKQFQCATKYRFVKIFEICLLSIVL